MFWRKMLAGAVLLLLLLAAVSAWAAETARIVVDGRPINPNPPAVIMGGRVMVPLRGTLEAMGAQVTFTPPRTIYVTREERLIELEIGRRIAVVDGRQYLLDAPPVVSGGYTRVPLRFVGEALGAQVHFDRATRTVTVATTPSAAEAAPFPVPSPFPAPPEPQPLPPIGQPAPWPVPPSTDTQPFPTPMPSPEAPRPARPTLVSPLPGMSVGNPISVQGAASGAVRVRVTVSVPVVDLPIGSSEATVLPFVGFFSASVSYTSLFRGLPLTVSAVAIDPSGQESEPATVTVRQG